MGTGGSDLDEQGDLEEARGQPAEDEGADDEQGGEQSLAVPDVVHGVAGPVPVRPPHLHVDPPVRVGDDEEGDESDGEDEVLALVVGVLHELAIVEVARHLAELGHVGEEDGAAADEGDEPDGADEERAFSAAEDGGVVQRVHDGHVVVQRHGQQVEQRDDDGHRVQREVEGAGAGEGQALLGRRGEARHGVEDAVEDVADGADAEQHVGQAQADHQLEVRDQAVGAQQGGGDGQEVGHQRQRAQRHADDGHGLRQHHPGPLADAQHLRLPPDQRQVPALRHAHHLHGNGGGEAGGHGEGAALVGLASHHLVVSSGWKGRVDLR